jgi:hypothetical protein
VSGGHVAYRPNACKGRIAGGKPRACAAPAAVIGSGPRR